MWKYQYERVKRWLSRIEKTNDPKYRIDPQDALDYITAFFQNCYHLKDWLKNDPSISDNHVLKAKIEDFSIRKSKFVRISQNIANGSKHGEFENHRRISKGLSVNIVGDKSTGIWQSASFIYTQRNKSYEAIDLAQKCVQEWDEFLKKNIPDSN